MGETASSCTAAVRFPGVLKSTRGWGCLVCAAGVWVALASPAWSQGAAGPEDPALSDARAVAAQRPDLAVMRVSGQSMLPYFDGDTIIVAQRIDSSRLRVGMIAVYVNRSGKTVAHRVVAKVHGGWRVRGYHNVRADRTIVSDRNLLGVVYATFAMTMPASAPRPWGRRPDVPTAYAAPAD